MSPSALTSLETECTRHRRRPLGGSLWTQGIGRRTGGRIHAFTLIELLVVLAIVGILAAILMPATLSVRASADRARTRVLFQRWIAALENFRQEYGRYPVLAPDFKLNGGASADPSAVHPFHDVLAGRRRDGSRLPDPMGEPAAERPEVQNPRRIPFLQATAAELFPANHEVAGWRHLLRDPFDNPDIAVLIDANLDGVIDRLDVPSLPEVSPPDALSVRLAPLPADFPASGLLAGVALYCAPPGATEAAQLILSWKQ